MPEKLWTNSLHYRKQNGKQTVQSKDLYKYLGKSYTIWAIKMRNEKGYFVPDNKFGSEMSNYAMALSSKNGQVEVK